MTRDLRLTVATFGNSTFTLAARRHGPDTGRPIVMVHGFLDQCLTWDPVATRLVEALQRPVLAIDQRGHGLSDHVGPGGAYHIWDHVADLAAVLDRLGQPVDLVGHSMGGTVCALLAATQPEAVRTLTLLEGLGPPDLVDRAVARARDFVACRRQPRLHPVFPTVEAAAARMTAVDPDLGPDLARRLATRLARPVQPGDPAVRDPEATGLTWTWDARHRARHPYPFSADLHRRFLQEVRAPVRVLSGDRGFRPPDHDDRVAALSHATARVLPDVGHQLHRDAPDAVAEEILSVVRQADRT